MSLYKTQDGITRDDLSLEELHYDIFQGYIQAKDILKNADDIDEVNSAINIVDKFISTLSELEEELIRKERYPWVITAS